LRQFTIGLVRHRTHSGWDRHIGRRGAMKTFVQRFRDKILGVLSCFDRLRFRGSLRSLSYVGGVASWLNAAGILLKDFLPFAEKLTKQLRRDTEQFAEDAGRPVRYLESKVDKEQLVQGTCRRTAACTASTRARSSAT
jgi:hypothetical protein